MTFILKDLKKVLLSILKYIPIKIRKELKTRLDILFKCLNVDIIIAFMLRIFKTKLNCASCVRKRYYENQAITETLDSRCREITARKMHFKDIFFHNRNIVLLYIRYFCIDK